MQNTSLKQGDRCPKCKDGMLIPKVNKNYQPFLSCDSFPYCRFSVNLTLEDYKNKFE